MLDQNLWVLTYLIFILANNLQEIEKVLNEWLVDSLSAWVFYTLSDWSVCLK